MRERWTAVVVMATLALATVGCSSSGQVDVRGSVTEPPATSAASSDAVEVTGMIRDATGLAVDPPQGTVASELDALRPVGVTSAAKAVGNGPVVIATFVFESPERAHTYFTQHWGPTGDLRNRPNSSMYTAAAVCGPVLVTINTIGSIERPKLALPRLPMH